jgi:hypothetical protein
VAYIGSLKCLNLSLSDVGESFRRKPFSAPHLTVSSEKLPKAC